MIKPQKFTKRLATNAIFLNLNLKEIAAGSVIPGALDFLGFPDWVSLLSFAFYIVSFATWKKVLGIGQVEKVLTRSKYISMNELR